MIRFSEVSFTYSGVPTPTLDRVDLTIDEGELCLVVGRTGSGKSTLLRAINGLVPHFTGGHLSGRVTVDGRSTRDFPPRELAEVVGVVGQDPASSFVTDTVEDELAYTMENLGIAPEAMRRRVEDTLDLLGLHELRHRPLTSLSGGQQQRAAIGAVLCASPRVLVLDEPTSALDPNSRARVAALLQAWKKDRIVITTSHDPELIRQADEIRLFERGRLVRAGSYDDLVRESATLRRILRIEAGPASGIRMKVS